MLETPFFKFIVQLCCYNFFFIESLLKKYNFIKNVLKIINFSVKFKKIHFNYMVFDNEIKIRNI